MSFTLLWSCLRWISIHRHVEIVILGLPFLGINGFAVAWLPSGKLTFLRPKWLFLLGKAVKTDYFSWLNHDEPPWLPSGGLTWKLKTHVFVSGNQLSRLDVPRNQVTCFSKYGCPHFFLHFFWVITQPFFCFPIWRNHRMINHEQPWPTMFIHD